MGCIIKYKNQSIPEEQFLRYLNKQIAINNLFNEDKSLANAVYEAVGFKNKNNIEIDVSSIKDGLNKLSIKNDGKVVGNIDLFKEGSYVTVGFINIIEEERNKGIAKNTYLTIADSLPEGVKLKSGETRTAEIERVWSSLEKQGLTTKESNEFGDYYVLNSQITSQQKQQSLQIYSQYLESLNKPNTNPILQGNQEEQVKKFTELQERLSNKEFLEGAKNAFESSEKLQQFGTQEEYNDYIAKASLGIIKNPSSGGYNYTSKVKDIVYHASKWFRGLLETGKYDMSMQGRNFGFNYAQGASFALDIPSVLYWQNLVEADGYIAAIVNINELRNTNEISQKEHDTFKNDIKKKYNKFRSMAENNFDVMFFNQMLPEKTLPGGVIVPIGDIGKDTTYKERLAFVNKKEKEELDKLNSYKIINNFDAEIIESDGKELVIKNSEQIHILGSEPDIQGFKNWVNNRNNFDKELAQKIQDILQKLYPEIKLNITNNPVWEQGDNVFNQEEYNNQVNYRLKATEKVLDNLNKIKQWESNKSIDQNTLWKKIGELGISKQQLDLLKESEGSTIEEKLSSFAANYSYTIEINTAKENKVNQIGNINKEEWDKRVQELANQGLSIEERRDILEKEFNTSSIPTQHYSNLTVPGGTNYTENEIKTPDITPNIKGHAQFSTDNGIGWFRSDDRDNSGITEISSESKLESNYEYSWSAEQFSYNGSIYKVLTESEPGLGSYDTYYKDNKQITKKEYQEAFDNKPKKDNSKTRRILEVQSDLFQKGRDKEDLVTKEDYNAIQGSNQGYGLFSLRNINYAKTRSGFFKNGIKISEEEYNKALEEHNKPSTYGEKHIKENNFLQLLNKDNNWVTFFVKSIIQDSAKKGYEKVLFPTGETAAKVEGHETIAEELEKINKEQDSFNEGLYIKEQVDNVFGKNIITYKAVNKLGKEFNASRNKEDIEIYISNYKKDQQREYDALEQRKSELKSQGLEKLKPIEAFYEIKVGNILEKQFGKDNVKTITDEYGNQWREITIDQARDLQNILLQKDEANRIIGQANIKAMTVLVDAINQKQDTLPHEYAHHYIAWFRNTPIVQEAIKKWGSEEALVQSIGEQVVKQKGEAYNWWNRFVKWIMNQFNSLSKLQKEELTQILTDAFLTRQDLNNIGNNSFQQFQQSYNEEKSLKLALKGLTPEEKISFCNHFGITMTEENGKKC